MTSLLQNTRRPDISFYRNGRIDITARVVRLLDIKPGDVLDIVKDRSEYYLRVRLRQTDIIGRHEAQCFPTCRRGKIVGSYRAYSSRLANAIIDACDTRAQYVRLPCGAITHTDSVKLLPIITRHPL